MSSHEDWCSVSHNDATCKPEGYCEECGELYSDCQCFNDEAVEEVNEEFDDEDETQ